MIRKKAGQNDGPRSIDQPSMGIFGTAIPQHFYESLSDRLLSNGLVSRFIVLEAGRRSTGQDAAIIDPPHELVEIAQRWADYCPPGGDLAGIHPVPAVVPMRPEARRLRQSIRELVDAEYAVYERDGNVTAMTIWSRLLETAGKLALIYAASDDCGTLELSIRRDAIQWGYDVARWAAGNLLRRCGQHVAASLHDRQTLRIQRLLIAAPGGRMKHHELLTRSRMAAKVLLEVLETMVQRREVEVQIEQQPGSGRPSRFYRWVPERDRQFE